MVSFQEAIKFIKRYLFESVEFPDGKVASDFLTRQNSPPKTRKEIKKAAEDSGEILSENESKSGDEDNDLDGFIVRGGGNDDAEEQSASDSERAQKKKHKRKSEKAELLVEVRKRHKSGNSTSRSDRQRVEREIELRKYKSADYVHESDDEAPPEELNRFFEAEQRIRDSYKKLAPKLDSLEQVVDDQIAKPLDFSKEDSDSQESLDDEQDGFVENSDNSDDDASMGRLSSTSPTTSSPKHNLAPIVRSRKIVVDSDED